MKKILMAGALLALSTSVLAASGDPEVGRKKSTPCAACHGANGVSPTPAFPNLAGQYVDYLVASLNHYKNGKRKNPIMQAQVAALTPKDIADLSAFFASQRNGLQVKH
jgi:cytochrome c553